MTNRPHDDRPSPDHAAGQEPAAANDKISLRAEEPTPVVDEWGHAIQEKIAEERKIDQAIQDMELAEAPVRFSVRDVLLLTAFAACLLALFRVVRPEVYALTLGALAFISLVVLSLLRPREGAILTVGWWVLLAVYLISALAVTLRA